MDKEQRFFNFLSREAKQEKINVNSLLIDFLRDYAMFLSESGDKDDSRAIFNLIGVNKSEVTYADLHPNKHTPPILDLNILTYDEQSAKSRDYFLRSYADPLKRYTTILVNNISSKPERAFKMLISGRPGTGKTSYVNYLSYKVGLNLYSLKASKLISSFIGDTQKNIDLLANDIKKIGSEGIIFIDELDSIFGSRKDTINDEYKKMIGAFNIFLDSIKEKTKLIAVTNEKGYIDDAIIRRFNVEIILNEVDPENFYQAFILKTEAENIVVKNEIIKKIIDYFDSKSTFREFADYSLIDKVIDNYLFLEENIYMNFYSLFFRDTTIEKIKDDEYKRVLANHLYDDVKLNKTEIATFLEEDSRKISKLLE